MKIGEFVEWERKVGQPIYAEGGRVVRPISRVLSVWWRPYGGGVWNLPVAVQIEEYGSLQEIPIVNVNLWAQIGIGLMVILVNLFILTAGKRRSQQEI